MVAYLLALVRRKFLKLVLGRSVINNILSIENIVPKLDDIYAKLSELDGIQAKLSELDGIQAKLLVIDENIFLSKYNTLQIHYDKVKEVLKRKKNAKRKITVAFFVIYDSTFPAQPLYEAMLTSSIFSPFIVVIPDVLRGKKNMFSQLDKTYHVLSAKYSNVFISYNKEESKFIDIFDKCDMVCTANPYDAMTYRYYQITYLSHFDILLFYMNYAYSVSNWWAHHMYHDKSLPCLWKYFLENALISEELKVKSFMPPRSLAITGYLKMDRLAGIPEHKRERKRIIIAPHHTVIQNSDPGVINFSNFLQYAYFFQKLFQKYPEIDFVFRPHQLLKVALERDDIWGIDKTEKYFETMKETPNVEYQDGGDYFETFVNSDALIHDCGSFMAEYLYTDHPACYLLKDEDTNRENYSSFGLECIARHYPAHNESDIIHFIDNVVMKGEDTMKRERILFAENKIRINYPHATQIVIKEIENELFA
jgi:hypothetical protein